MLNKFVHKIILRTKNANNCVIICMEITAKAFILHSYLHTTNSIPYVDYSECPARVSYNLNCLNDKPVLSKHCAYKQGEYSLIISHTSVPSFSLDSFKHINNSVRAGCVSMATAINSKMSIFMSTYSVLADNLLTNTSLIVTPCDPSML